MAKGSIKVDADNIFPIIKKFLYSDHEIFLRELVSNAVDATQKLRTLKKLGEYKGELGDTTIEVKVNKDDKTIRIIDKGIGMSLEEVKKYLNQVAFSSAEEFLKKYEGKSDEAQVIGHFGLGFYSAFMVAEKVEVFTKSHKDEPAVHWICDGNPEYNTKKHDRTERGTEIVLHVAKDSEEFLEEQRLRGILDKYCKFLPVEIKFGTKTIKVDDPDGKKDDDGNLLKHDEEVDDIINNPKPAWTKSPQDLKEADYKSFYRELYPMTFEEPLFNIHLNVDYPFNLTGILYFPRLKENIDLNRNKIQLYSNQVFVTDSVENIVPEFLTLLHGVIDSPDIPLNVSRSYLQSDANVRKISGHISKKVADKLNEMFKKDREDFNTKWSDIKLFVEYGALTDEKFFGRMEKSILFTDTNNNKYTFEELKAAIEKEQTDKDGNLKVLYCQNATEQHSYIEKANERGYKVIVLDSPIASHFIQKLEGAWEKVQFARVDADTLDKLIPKTDVAESNLTEDQQKELTPIIEGVVEKEKFQISYESLHENEAPMVITEPEFMRRMKEQSQTGGGMFGMQNLPDQYNLVVNSNHPLISKILLEKEEEQKKNLAKQAADLALLSRNLLKGKDLSDFVKRSIDLLG